MAIKQRVEELERSLAPDDSAGEVVVFLRDGVYTRGGAVITEQEYQALCRSMDVFTVEVTCYPESAESKD